MHNNSAVHALKKISLFTNLGHQNLKRVAMLAKVHEAPKGSLIFKKQTAGNHLFIVLQGKIKIYSEVAGGTKRKTFAYLKSGEFFGEMSLLDRKGRSLSACALEDSRLLTISKKEFERLILRDSVFCYKIIHTLIERMRRANDEIESLTFRSLYGRVCRKLWEMASETKNANGSTITLPVTITHIELAELAGTAREIVTKILSSLRRLKVIAYADHKITILAPIKLQELAQAEP